MPSSEAARKATAPETAAARTIPAGRKPANPFGSGSFSGTACYANTIPEIPAAECIKLDLGDLAESATICLNGEYVGTVLKTPYELYIDSTRFKGNDTLQVYVSNLMANRIADMDRKKIPWKRFYNVNIAARRPENRKEGIFNASDWKPMPSGLFGPVTLTPMRKFRPNTSAH